jgi:DNA-binding transcriptional LysR family regulator
LAFTSENVRLFLAVLDHGSFSAAARVLGRVPSAVSMAIANLEAELDLQLFDRTGREPVPTAAARALEPEARAIARGLRQIEAHALSLHAGLERRLRLAVAAELMSMDWDVPLAAISADYPALEIAVRTGSQDEMLDLLCNDGAELALVFERPTLDDREAFEEVGESVLVAVAAPAHMLLTERRPRLGDLADHRQVAVVGRDPARVDPRLVLSRAIWRVDSHLAALRLVEAGLGWAFLPEPLAAPGIAAGRLARLPLAGATNAVRLWVDVVWRNDRPLGLAARRYVAAIARRGSTLGER